MSQLESQLVLGGTKEQCLKEPFLCKLIMNLLKSKAVIRLESSEFTAFAKKMKEVAVAFTDA
jgi:hypothetical protein